MKKTLMGTSAGALLAVIATPAAAAEWEFNLGGYMEQHLGFASFDSAPGTDFDGVDIKSDQEIYFRPSITLDNGITFEARVDLEGASSGGDRVDEPHMRINGSFGSFRIGEDDLASYDVMVVAPDVSFMNINSGSNTAWEPGGGLLPISNAAMTRTTFPAVATDPVNITYFTPRFAGFQLGVSYAPEGSQSDADGQPNRNGTTVTATVAPTGATNTRSATLTDIFAVGANYTNSFGDFSVAASAGWSIAQVETGPGGTDGDTQAYAFGLNLGYGGFTIGGSWGEGNDVPGTTTVPFAGVPGPVTLGGADGRTYDAGVSYETGPWGFSFTYLHAEAAAGEIDDFLLAVRYALAQGVRLGAFAIYSTQDPSAAGAPDVDGFVIGTSIRLDF